MSPPVQEPGLPALRPQLTRRCGAGEGARALKPALPRSGPHSLAGLVQSVIAAVNARGMCAAQAARVAELPISEVDDIQRRCGCPICTRSRAH